VDATVYISTYAGGLMMDAAKIEKVNTFRTWLNYNDIAFAEYANGHFKIYEPEHQTLIAQVWATTGKFINEATGATGQGLMFAKKLILGPEVPYVEPVRPATNEDTDVPWVDDVTDKAIKAEQYLMSKPKVSDLRRRFIDTITALGDFDMPQYLVVAVKLPTGATELITNTIMIKEKIEYYISAYDDTFRLKTNPEVSIVGFMLV
jgi:hypothetical protein